MLEKETDLVLQIHMQRTGKTELLQPSIGFYFTNKPPAKAALLIGLLSQLIDIPPGEKNYVVERTFKLPVDVQVLGVMPHLHYLGKEVQGFATLPDGARKWLIFIKHWDFNWQGEFRYTKPVFLPKGSILTMRYTYDNSAENLRNPNHPPRRVTFGPQSTDEMGELWLQVLPGTRTIWSSWSANRSSWSRARPPPFMKIFFVRIRTTHPRTWSWAKCWARLAKPPPPRNISRPRCDLIRIGPKLTTYSASSFLTKNNIPQARAEFESELRLNPNHYKAHVRLGLICIEEQNLDQAEAHLRAAVRINPKDSTAQEILARIVKAQGPGPSRKYSIRYCIQSAHCPKLANMRQRLFILLMVACTGVVDERLLASADFAGASTHKRSSGVSGHQRGPPRTVCSPASVSSPATRVPVDVRNVMRNNTRAGIGVTIAP